MKNQMNYPIQLKIFIGSTAIIALASVIALFAISGISPALPNQEMIMLFLLIVSVVSIIFVSRIAYTGRVLPPPGPNPHRVTLYLDSDLSNPILDINNIGSDSSGPNISSGHTAQTINTFELTYLFSSSSPENNSVLAIDSNNVVISAAAAGAPVVTVTRDGNNNKKKKVVFKVKKDENLSEVKVTVPDEILIPKGKKEFHLEFK